MRFITTLSAIALFGLVAAQTDDSGTGTTRPHGASRTIEDSSSATGGSLDGGDVCPSGGNVYKSYCCVGTLLSTSGAAASSTGSSDDSSAAASSSSSDDSSGGGGNGGIPTTLPHLGSAKVPIPVRPSSAPQKRAAPASGRAKSMSHTLPDGAVCDGTLITLSGSGGSGSGAAATTTSSSSLGPLASLGAAASTTTSSDDASSTTESATSSSSSGAAAPGSFGEVRVAALLGAGVGVGMGMGLM